MIGQTLGSYQIERELGRGGMGSVWVGVHALLGRRAAIKVLLPELSRNQDIVQRFFNEARAATAVKHAGIVEIYDFGWAPDGSAYIVMELLDGEPLSARMKRLGRLPVGLALGVARQIATSLAAAHKAGVIHRDLKPDNVFLVPDPELAIGERIKLLDFGIAKLATEQPDALRRTQTGAVMGTPYYMSPEQCRGAGAIDARSDLYSLGCILYEMIGGRVPFVGEGAGEIIGAHLHVAVPPLRELAADVPDAVEAIALRLLAKTPDGRPATAELAAQELAAVASALGSGIIALPPPGPVSAPAAIAREPSQGGHATTLGGAASESAAMPAVRDRLDSELEPPRSRLGLWVGASVLVLAGGAFAVLLATKGAGNRDTAQGVAPVDAARVTNVIVDAGVVGDGAIPAEQTIEAARRLVEAHQFVDAKNWAEALKAAKDVIALAPESVEAQQIFAQAQKELGLTEKPQPKPQPKPKPKPEPKPEPTPQGTVRVSAIHGDVGRSDSVMKRAIVQRQGALKTCYQKALKADAKLAGSLKVRMTVDASGAVSNTRPSGGTIRDEGLANCALKQLDAVSLGAGDRGPIEVTLTFQP